MRPLRAGDDYDRAAANLARWAIEHAVELIERFPPDVSFLPFGVDEELRTVYAVAMGAEGQESMRLFEARLSSELWSDEEFFRSRRVEVGVTPGGPAMSSREILAALKMWNEEREG